MKQEYNEGREIAWDADHNVVTVNETKVTAEYDKLLPKFSQYAWDREDEYALLNQFELISDDAINGTTTYADTITAIKTKWPKDNSGPVE